LLSLNAILILSSSSLISLTFETPILLPPLFGLTIHGVLICPLILDKSTDASLVNNICFDDGISRLFINSIYFFLSKVKFETKLLQPV